MTEETMDRRVRKAVERILDDESLTSDLEDAPAKVLIDWGMAEVERRARLTAHILNDDEASEVLDQAVSRVRRVMKRVAKSAEADGITSRDELIRMLAQTLSAVEAAEAAEAVPVPAPRAVEEPAVLEPEVVVLPSEVDLITPVPPKPVEEVVLPSAVDLVAPAPPAAKETPPPKPADQGFLARLRRFFGI